MTSPSYRIYVDSQMYAGTLGHQRGRWSMDDRTNEWPTRAAALAALRDAVGAERNADGTYSRPGSYVCRHGQYARPFYTIRRAS